jgi:hypothetical protein
MSLALPLLLLRREWKNHKKEIKISQKTFLSVVHVKQVKGVENEKRHEPWQ